MNSFIFTSNNCKTCDDKPFESHERRVLRTSTEDICCTCGSVLQTFPAMTGFSPDKNIISIPPAVSTVLARLLKLRLFILDRGHQPSRVTRHQVDLDRMAKTLAHRAGDQVYIELRGPGNCSGELRWSYSVKSLLPKFPWEESSYEGGRLRQRSELKPLLSELDGLRPARIVRACQVLDDFEFMGFYADGHAPSRKTVRFERRLNVDTQLLDTTEDLCLILKAEFNWLQIGSSLPDETGPRVYNLSTQYLGYPGTIEEAIDQAIDVAMTGRPIRAVDIYHQRDRIRRLVEVENPLTRASRTGHYTIAACTREDGVDHHSGLIVRGNDVGYRGAVRAADGRNLVPAGFDYDVEVQMPFTQSCQDVTMPHVSVIVMLVNDAIFAEHSFGPKGSYKQYTLYRGWIGYQMELHGDLPQVAGKTITTRITDSKGTEEKTYTIVSVRDYAAAWAALDNPVIDLYKREIAAQIYATDATGCYPTRSRPAVATGDFAAGQAVAALIDGRWLEAVYVAPTDGTTSGVHSVIVSARSGQEKWHVSALKPLSEALMEGLYVVGPYNTATPVGALSQIV